MRATRIVGLPSLTLPSASSHPTPSPPHALRNTLFVVVVSTLKAVPISTQYFLTSVLVQLTRMPSVVTCELTKKGTHTYAAYKTRCSDCAPDNFFQGNFLTPPTQIILEKIPRKKLPDGHKTFRKIIFPHFLVAIADLTHPLSNNRSSIRIIGCCLEWGFLRH